MLSAKDKLYVNHLGLINMIMLISRDILLERERERETQTKLIYNNIRNYARKFAIKNLSSNFFKGLISKISSFNILFFDKILRIKAVCKLAHGFACIHIT